MQDATCQNFGCLNDEELEFMLEPDNISLLVLHSCVFFIII